MKILLTFRSGSMGHLMPLLPLAEAADARGHQVAFASGADRASAVTSRGYEFFRAGLTYAEQGLETRRRYPDWPWGPDLHHVYSLIFAGIAGPAMARDLSSVVDAYRPDLLIVEQAEFGGPVAAASASIRWATVGFGLPIPQATATAAEEAAAPMWEEHGLELLRYGGLYEHCYLDPCPSSLNPGDGPTITRSQPLRPDTPQSDQPLPAWLRDLSVRPTIYATLGTAGSFSTHADRLLDAVATGLGSLEVNVVITGTAGDADATLPVNVHTANFIPLRHLLPRCQLVVSHAGAGTTLAAAAHGIPQLLLPMGADQFRNADAVTRVGAGRSLDMTGLDGPTLRQQVDELLTDAEALAAAQRLRQEVRSMPSPEAALTTLESL